MAVQTTQTPSEHAASLSARETVRYLDLSVIATLTAIVLGRFLIHEKGVIGTSLVGLAVGGTVSDGTLEIRKNGVLISAAALTLPNAQTDPTNSYTVVPASEALSKVEPGDVIEVVATAVATGSSGLTVSIPVAKRYSV